MDAMRAYLSRQSAISLLNMTGLGADTITGSMFSSQTSADSISLSDQSVSNSPSYANQIFASFSCSRLGKLSDFLTIILLSAMFYRT